MKEALVHQGLLRNGGGEEFGDLLSAGLAIRPSLVRYHHSCDEEMHRTLVMLTGEA